MDSLKSGTRQEGCNFVSPPQPKRLLLEAHENENDFLRRIFAKKTYRVHYHRPSLDLNRLLMAGENNNVPVESDLIVIELKESSKSKLNENLIEPEENIMIENFIKHY